MQTHRPSARPKSSRAGTVPDLRGKTVRWTFEDGPTAGTAYEHRVGADGSIEYRQGGSGPFQPATQGTVLRAGPVGVVSYLSEGGFALTAVLQPDGKVTAFASNEASWFQQVGTWSLVPKPQA